MAMQRAELIHQLQQDILRLQGFKPSHEETSRLGLGFIEKAFPNGIFPTGTIHEFISDRSEGSAATIGFISVLLSKLLAEGRLCLWISQSPTVFPVAVKRFGIEPDRIIFVNAPRAKDALWVLEEALKCEGLAAVIAEIPRISFIESRRLQLAVEKSKVTGFLLRHTTKLNTTASIARWKVTPLPGRLEAGMPGVGFPHWNIELQKVRNGKPGIWEAEYQPAGLQVITTTTNKEWISKAV
jgi:protein ImuA